MTTKRPAPPARKTPVKTSAASRVTKALSASKPAEKPAAKPTFKIPKGLPAVADRYYTVQNERLALQKEVDKLAAEEAALREELIQKLPKSDATGIAGRLASVRVETKEIFNVKDWKKFHTFIAGEVKTKGIAAFAAFQKRVTPEVIKEYMEAKKGKVPGVEKINVPVVRMSSVVQK